MAELKTKLNDADVGKFLESIEDETKREDCLRICQIMQDVTGSEPKMWGKSIVGFGTYHYVYESGREGDWMVTGFAPRSRNISVYLIDGFSDHEELLGELGKHKTGKSCLYVKKLEDIDQDVLRELVGESVENMKSKYECTF